MVSGYKWWLVVIALRCGIFYCIPIILYEISCYYGFERLVFEIIKDGLLDFRKDIIRKRIGGF